MGIGFRNISKGIQGIQLLSDYKKTTVLLDDDVRTEINIISVEGITERGMEINPGAMKLATFTFPFPQGVKKARFVSMWWCQGEIPLSIPFTIPPERKV